ncbi:MAG: hypothetical protein IKY30_07965 [Oscillospiraceae bacterium]|nr:hypothetical protein [Oscillospiraceae bacterium]
MGFTPTKEQIDEKIKELDSKIAKYTTSFVELLYSDKDTPLHCAFYPDIKSLRVKDIDNKSLLKFLDYHNINLDPQTSMIMGYYDFSVFMSGKKGHLVTNDRLCYTTDEGELVTIEFETSERYIRPNASSNRWKYNTLEVLYSDGSKKTYPTHNSSQSKLYYELIFNKAMLIKATHEKNKLLAEPESFPEYYFKKYEPDEDDLMYLPTYFDDDVTDILNTKVEEKPVMEEKPTQEQIDKKLKYLASMKNRYYNALSDFTSTPYKGYDKAFYITDPVTDAIVNFVRIHKPAITKQDKIMDFVDYSTAKDGSLGRLLTDNTLYYTTNDGRLHTIVFQTAEDTILYCDYYSSYPDYFIRTKQFFGEKNYRYYPTDSKEQAVYFSTFISRLANACAITKEDYIVSETPDAYPVEYYTNDAYKPQSPDCFKVKLDKNDISPEFNLSKEEKIERKINTLHEKIKNSEEILIKVVKTGAPSPNLGFETENFSPSLKKFLDYHNLGNINTDAIIGFKDTSLLKNGKSGHLLTKNFFFIAQKKYNRFIPFEKDNQIISLATHGHIAINVSYSSCFDLLTDSEKDTFYIDNESAVEYYTKLINTIAPIVKYEKQIELCQTMADTLTDEYLADNDYINDMQFLTDTAHILPQNIVNAIKSGKMRFYDVSLKDYI